MAPRSRWWRTLALIVASTLRPGAGAHAEVAERVGENIVRFHATEAARAAARPSVALERPLASLGPAPEAFPVRPRFQIVHERHAVRVAIEPGTSLYGTGEVAGPLRRNGRRIQLWNTDAWGYDMESPALYQSHPWVLAVRADGSAYGVLFDTPERAQLDLSREILFVADGPAFPVIVIERDSPQGVVRALAELTGRMPMPPRWALGYHQCRWGYYPDARVRAIARSFRERRIPCDVVWLDIDYMDGFRCFTFSPQHFPDPGGLDADLHALGFRTVWMIDPGIKMDPGYEVYRSGVERDVWVKDSSGAPYVGAVWPGRCVFPDFTRAPVRAWWADLYADFMAHGVDGVWNDMNEPSIFGVPTKTMPVDNRHDADPELGGPGTHARYHNVYGMQMVRATREGVAAARPDRRPFVLTRANHLGGQRYAATWTGDNTSSWEHLDASIPMVLNLGLSGQPFAGPDIGGFAGDGDGALFARWMGLGALLPFARGHTAKNTRAKEPWVFGLEVERTCRLAIERRYRLLPHLYTLFREASETGLPVARPLFFADPADTALRAEDDAFLLGADVLVVAHTSRDGHREPRRPRGVWRPLRLVPGEAGNPDLPEVLVRAGAIVPLGPIVQWSDERPLNPLELVVSLDAAGRAEGVLYEDDGDGHAHRDGAFRLVRVTAVREGDAVRVRARVEDGRWDLPDREVVVRVLLDDREARASARGHDVRVSLAAEE